MRARTVIVGGGIMGTSIAMHLAAELDALTEPVLLLERKILGSGSSGRSGAILRCHYSDREVARMASDSLAEYAAFEARHQRPIGFQRCGVLTIAGPRSGEWQDRVRANVAMMRDLAIDTRVIEAGEIASLLRGARVAPGTIAGWEPEAGFVDPERSVAAFGAHARARGAEVHEGAEVVELIVAARGGAAMATMDARVTGVRTAGGDSHQAEQVVLVAGPWTRGLLERIGVDLPLRAVRPQNGFLRTPAIETASPWTTPGARASAGVFAELPWVAPSGSSEPRAAHPVMIDLEHGFYARCEPSRGRTRTGHIDYDRDAALENPDALDEHVGESTRRELQDMLARRMPVYAEAADAGAIAAWYTLTPDAQAIIGPVPGIAGLFVVSGFSGHGFKLAPSVGLGVAQMLLGRPISAFDPEFFSPGRFAGRARDHWGGRFGL